MRDRVKEGRSSSAFRMVLVLVVVVVVAVVAAPDRLRAQQPRPADDRGITKPGGPVSKAASCPGGDCRTAALGARGEGVTVPSGTARPTAVPARCSGQRCPELPRAGELGGITKRSDAAAGDREAAPEAASADGARAAAAPVCQGENTTNAYNDNISMGGPLVGIEWVPTAAVTVTAVEVFSGEVAAPSRLAIWSDDGGSPAKPLAALAWTGSFNTALPNGWYGAGLAAPVSVAPGVRYWVVWDPSGGEQAAVASTGIQQVYWGSSTGNVQGGASWFGPFSHSDHRWKFRLRCGNVPCDGNNNGDAVHLDNVSMGGSMVAIAWTPAMSGTVTRIELYTGEVTATNQVALWSGSSSGPAAPLAPSSWSSPFNVTSGKGWQGANLLAPVGVTAGSLYWVVWDPVSGQQAPVTNTGIQQTYWGSGSGNVTGGAAWNGPYNFTDRRWKLRVFCKDGPCDGNNHLDTTHLDSVSMGGPMVAIRWVAAKDNTITGVEVFTGEAAAPNRLALWTDNAGQPGALLGFTGTFTTSPFKSWQGAPLGGPVSVFQGQTYWVVWDPAGGEQSAVTNTGVTQPYWGSSTGTVTGGASWFGPFSFPDRRWKLRLLCGLRPCDGTNATKSGVAEPSAQQE